MTLMHRVSNLQEYTEEVKQLLSLAKHPKTIALLQGALLRVQPAASSDGPATGRGPQAVVKAQRSAKEKPVYTAKINEYGEWVHGLSRSGNNPGSVCSGVLLLVLICIRTCKWVCGCSALNVII